MSQSDSDAICGLYIPLFPVFPSFSFANIIDATVQDSTTSVYLASHVCLFNYSHLLYLQFLINKSDDRLIL